MRFVGLLWFSLVVIGCEGKIVVPIRPCVVKGSSWTVAPDPGPDHFPPPPLEGGYFFSEGSAAIDQDVQDLVAKANGIWVPGANISFSPVVYPGETGHVPNGHFPVIPDPIPPGAGSILQVDKTQYGDIGIDPNGSPTTEMDLAVASCDAAWRRAGRNTAPDALIVIIARNLVQYTTGVSATSVGAGPGHHATTNRNNGADLCNFPRNLVKEDIRAQYAIVVDPALFLPSNIADTRHGSGEASGVLAHELGHDLMLSHGDGLDNDANGTAPPLAGSRLFDEDCDSHEFSTYDEAPGAQTRSVMSSTAGISTLVTPLQRELARSAAALAPGALGGPP